MKSGYMVGLSLHSGIPVLDVHGEWKPTLTDALNEMIVSLTRSGHFEIVINVRRTALEGISALTSLAHMANHVRKHCGHIDIVGTDDQLDILRNRFTGLFRLASTEECAIRNIMRIPVLSTGTRITARTQ